MLKDTDVVPEKTVEPGLHTVKFVPTALGLYVGDCLKLIAQNSVIYLQTNCTYQNIYTRLLRHIPEKLQRHKSPGVDQIPAELFKAGGRNICSEIHKLLNSIWNKEELPEE
jgi:hypothetical protein